MEQQNKPFLIKRLTVDFFDSKGNGILEESLRLKAPYVIKTQDGSLDQYCQALREFFMKLVRAEDPNKRIEIPIGTRMVHVKTNTHKRISISCMVIFTKDITDERTNATAGAAEEDYNWDDESTI